MKFYLQMGHNMQSMCRELSNTWGGATVILSPKNIYPTKRLFNYSDLLRGENVKVLLDPQLYTPQKRQKNLLKHDYWPPSDLTDIEMSDCTTLLKQLSYINKRLNCVLPKVN